MNKGYVNYVYCSQKLTDCGPLVAFSSEYLDLDSTYSIYKTSWYWSWSLRWDSTSKRHDGWCEELISFGCNIYQIDILCAPVDRCDNEESRLFSDANMWSEGAHNIWGTFGVGAPWTCSKRYEFHHGNRLFEKLHTPLNWEISKNETKVHLTLFFPVASGMASAPSSSFFSDDPTLDNLYDGLGNVKLKFELLVCLWLIGRHCWFHWLGLARWLRVAVFLTILSFWAFFWQWILCPNSVSKKQKKLFELLLVSWASLNYTEKVQDNWLCFCSHHILILRGWWVDMLCVDLQLWQKFFIKPPTANCMKFCTDLNWLSNRYVSRYQNCLRTLMQLHCTEWNWNRDLELHIVISDNNFGCSLINLAKALTRLLQILSQHLWVVG